jgi:hypothetical protein
MTDTTDNQVVSTYTQRLITKFEEEAETNFSIEQIIETINEFKLDEDKARAEKTDQVPVGKYKFKKVADVFKFDPQYLKWMLKQDWISKYPHFVKEVKKYI